MEPPITFQDANCLESQLHKPIVQLFATQNRTQPNQPWISEKRLLEKTVLNYRFDLFGVN